MEKLAPLKNGSCRVLPITDLTMPYFQRQIARTERIKENRETADLEYYDNDLLLAKEDGSPLDRRTVSSKFKNFLSRNELRHQRYHDLRHTAATHLYELSQGDYLLVASILGHGGKSAGDGNIKLNGVTERYISISLRQRNNALTAYHETVLFGVGEKISSVAL